MTSIGNELTQQTEDAPTQTIRVRLLYFGAAREEVGREEELLEVRAPATAASVFAEVLNAHPALRRFRRASTRATRSRSFRLSAAAQGKEAAQVSKRMSRTRRKIFLN
jgi:molybdopterin converting factor small subunit